MHWCPQESEAVMVSGGMVGMSLIMVRWYWNEIKMWVGLRLLARHIHRCGATCECRRYAKVVSLSA